MSYEGENLRNCSIESRSPCALSARLKNRRRGGDAAAHRAGRKSPCSACKRVRIALISPPIVGLRPRCRSNARRIRRRLVSGLQVYQPDFWRGNVLNGISTRAHSRPIEGQIYRRRGRNGGQFGLKPLEIRERVSEGHGGHKVIEFDGGPEAHFVRPVLARAARRHL